MATYKPQRNLRIDDTLYLKLKDVADKNLRSFNNQVEVILLEFIRKYEKANGEIKVNTDDLYE